VEGYDITSALEIETDNCMTYANSQRECTHIGSEYPPCTTVLDAVVMVIVQGVLSSGRERIRRVGTGE
jgi:hypothetical protein